MALIEHLEKLRHFQKLTQYRSINEGSRAMGISQAGLSKSIASLEEVLGTILFVRSNQGLVLTKEGQLTLEAAKEILSRAATLESNLRSLKASKVPKKLRIGMYDSIAVYFFSDLISYVQKIYQEVEITLLVDNSGNLARAIEEERVDVSIGVNLDKNQTKDAEFFLLFDDYYSFYKSAKIEQIINLPFLLHPLSSDANGKTVEDYLKTTIRKNTTHRILNFETLKTLTLQGLGIGVLPTQVAKPLVQLNQLIQIQIPRTSQMFGCHKIGFLASKKFLKEHRDFALDLYRLGEQWSKS